MSDTPQEPTPLNPDPQDAPTQADAPSDTELDELRKNLTTQELNERKTEARPSLIKRVTKPLTGALNRLRGTSPLKEREKGETDELPEARFEHILPPQEGLPPTKTLKTLPEPAGDEEATLAPLEPAPKSPLDATPEDASQTELGESLTLQADNWPFDDSLTHQEETPSAIEERFLPPSEDESGDLDSLPPANTFLEEPEKQDKPRGLRGIVTDILRRTKPLKPPETPPPYEVDDTVLAGRLGLSESGEPAVPAEDSQETEEMPWTPPPVETPWYEKRFDFTPGEAEATEQAEIELPHQEENETPPWPPDADDWMQNLQSERANLLEENQEPEEPSPDPDLSFEPYNPNAPYPHDPFAYSDDSVEDETYVDEQVAEYWGQGGVGEEEEFRPEAEGIEPGLYENGSLQDLTLEGMRDVALEEYEAAPGGAVIAPVEKRGWLGFTRTQTVIIAALSVILAVTITIGALVQVSRLAVRPAEPTAAATEPILVTEGAHPTGIELTGGWVIALRPSTIIEGKWQPQGAEWLRGSEVRRVVALPWNRQLEAVIKTLLPGDPIRLSFDNGQVITYQVDRVERITADSTSRLEDLTPSLLIVLAQEASTDRWLVTCSPVEVSPLR